jgi:hypothetical protein
VPYLNSISGLVATDVQDAIDELDDRLDTVEGDDQTEGSIAKSLKDAKDYTDDREADDIGYTDTNQTYALGSDLEAAIYAIDDELIAQNGRLNTIEGDANTAGSIAKVLQDARDYADAEILSAKSVLGTNFSVTDIAARDALTDLTVGDSVFVEDTGNQRWAQFKVTAVDPVIFTKIMDQTILINAIDGPGVKAAYENNADTNAFTDALLNKLNGIEENAKDDQDA